MHDLPITLTYRIQERRLFLIYAKILFSGFNDQNLQAHNVLRQLHKVPAMTLDAEMSASALKWAKYMASIKNIEHAKAGSPDNPEKDGENIAYMCKGEGETYPGQEPVYAW